MENKKGSVWLWIVILIIVIAIAIGVYFWLSGDGSLIDPVRSGIPQPPSLPN